MITLTQTKEVEKYRVNPEEGNITVELRGLSTDTKPTTFNGKDIDNGSEFIEIDTGKIYLFDKENEQWKEI